jgi:hypothetical protein
MRCIYIGLSIRSDFTALFRRPRFKVGIAKDVKFRWQFIEKDTPGSKDFPIFSVRVPFALEVETMLKNILKPWQRVYVGSGKTEWFSPPRLLTPFVLAGLILFLCLYWLLWLALALAGVGAGVMVLIYYFT